MNIKTIAICAYRDWAINTYINLRELFPSINFILIKSEDQFITLGEENNLPKLIFCIGWSSIISSDIVKEKIILGEAGSFYTKYGDVFASLCFVILLFINPVLLCLKK